MKSAIFCVFYFFGVLVSLGQEPVSNFDVLANVCIQQQLKFVNNTSDATSFEWDFCANDAETLTSNQDVTTLTGLTEGWGYKVVSDNNQWYGFAVGQNNNTLYRLDFGSSPLNDPTVTNLGNPGGLFSFPNGIEIYKDGSNWYGFVGLFNPNAGIIRLDFGSSLANSPTAQNLGMFGRSGRFWGARVIKEASDLILVILNRSSNEIIRVNYRDSFSNAIVNATHVFSNTITGANLTPGFDIVQVGSDWVALIASDLNSSIIQIKFTGSVLTPPTVEGTFATSINRPSQVKLVKEGARYVAVVTSEFTTLKMVDYKDLNPANSPTEIIHTLPSQFSVDALRFNGRTIIQGLGGGNKLKRLVFKSTCDASADLDTSAEPSGVTFSAAGQKNIELRSFNSTGFSSYGKEVAVSTNTAADIDFTSDGVCANNDVFFTAVNASGNITDYNWSFGANAATGTYQFGAAGSYDVELEVTALNGCLNFVEKSLTIYNEPSANFLVPTNNPLCTNQDYVFENTSTVDVGAPVSWSWQVEGVTQASTEDLTYAFTNSSAQDIKLIATIPGCEIEVTKNVSTLVDGPIVDFSTAGSCQNDIVSFTNASSGPVTSFSWAFGDGQGFIGTDASYAYTSPNTYSVVLSATSPTGCNNTKTKSLTIHSKPQTNFAPSLPPFACSGSPTTLNDLTPNPTDSNLDKWQWNFDDTGSGQNTSTNRNPQHTFSTAGIYDVTLTVTTNFLCAATLQLPVTISQTPVAAFTHDPACEDVPIHFTDASTGASTAWNWQMGTTFYTGSGTATHTFVNPGNVNATLMVTAANGCIASVTKPLIVPAKLVPDFSVFKNCTNQQTLFTDVTNSATDPITSQAWNFGGLGNGTGSPETFTFDNTGNVNVTLNLLALSGCQYSRTKPVSIAGSPTASFTATPEAGGPPLEVEFVNTSINATSYLWEFGDDNNTTSTDDTPDAVTYENMGEYQASLTAYNALNCSHTVMHSIQVLTAFLEVAIGGLQLIEFPDGTIKPAVTIFNNGNISISNVGLILNMPGPVILDRVPATIKAHASYRHVFDFEFPAQYDEGYFCIEADIDDVEENDNTACLSLDASFTVVAPHPNPAHGQLNLSWILKEDGLVTIEILNSMGQRVTNLQVDCQEGLTPLSLSTAGMGAGVYFLKIQYNQISKVYRVLVSE